MENKFSEGLNNVFKLSKSEAKRLQSEFLSTEHFLLGIIKTDNSAKEILENLQADLTQIRRKIENMNQNTNPFAEEKDSISLTKLADYALKRADLESRQYKSSEINTVHLLLGILYKIEAPATSIFGSYDADADSVAL